MNSSKFLPKMSGCLLGIIAWGKGGQASERTSERTITDAWPQKGGQGSERASKRPEKLHAPDSDP